MWRYHFVLALPLQHVLIPIWANPERIWLWNPEHSSRNLESGKFLLVDSRISGFWNLEYSSRNPESGIPLTIVIQNPVPVIRNPRRRIQTVLDSFTWADNILTKKIKHWRKNGGSSTTFCIHTLLLVHAMYACAWRQGIHLIPFWCPRYI